MDIVQKLTELLKAHKKDVSGFDPNATFDSMGFDSLDKAEILMDIEDEFKIELDLSGDAELNTVGELVSMIEKAIK